MGADLERAMALRQEKEAARVDRTGAGHLFDRAMPDIWGWPWRLWRRGHVAAEAADAAPILGVVDANGDTVVRVPLPGAQPDDIRLAMEGNTLVVRVFNSAAREARASPSQPDRTPGHLVFIKGIKSGVFKATYQDGSLEVRVCRLAVPDTLANTDGQNAAPTEYVRSSAQHPIQGAPVTPAPTI